VRVEHEREMTKRREKLRNAGLALVDAEESAKVNTAKENKEKNENKRKHEIILAQQRFVREKLYGDPTKLLIMGIMQ